MPVDMTCEDCETFICSKCVKEDHKEHCWNTLSTAAKLSFSVKTSIACSPHWNESHLSQNFIHFYIIKKVHISIMHGYKQNVRIKKYSNIKAIEWCVNKKQMNQMITVFKLMF